VNVAVPVAALYVGSISNGPDPASQVMCVNWTCRWPVLGLVPIEMSLVGHLELHVGQGHAARLGGEGVIPRCGGVAGAARRLNREVVEGAGSQVRDRLRVACDLLAVHRGALAIARGRTIDHLRARGNVRRPRDGR
jgi:hypothetical protein